MTRTIDAEREQATLFDVDLLLPGVRVPANLEASVPHRRR